MTDIQLAKLMGLAAITVGGFRAIAAHRISRDLGLGSPSLVRSLAAQKVALGIGILAYPDNAGPMWGRVAADVMDLAGLAPGLGSANRRRHRAAAAALAIFAGLVIDVAIATSLERRAGKALATARRTRVKHIPGV